MSRESQTSNLASGNWLVGAIKKHPEGLLLLAAGCALLLRSGGSSRATTSSGQQHPPRATDGRFQDAGSRSGHHGAGDWNVGEGLSQAAESAQGYASRVTDKVSETATAYASSAADYASSAASHAAGYMDDARRTVSEQSGRFARQAQSTLQDTISRIVQEQPLAVVVAGLAAGAAIAAAFPATEIEKRTFGPAGERMTEAAGQFREQLKEGAAKAGEELVRAAEERGLDAEGLTEAAREAAGAFGSAFSGGQSAQSGSGGGQRGA
ncbi:MAG TPA: hypothetical protein VH835_07500 [Dongiaceae bacterium]|jgi:hypothetical protein